MKRALFLRTSSKPIPRVKRVSVVVEDIGYDALFVGAFREEGLPVEEEWDGLRVKRVGSYYPMLNGNGIFTYLKGVFNYNLGAYRLLKKEKPTLVHFSDVESFFGLFFYRLFNKTKILYNIHDNFGQRYPLPKFINGILNCFEGLIVLFADKTIVPEKFRAEALPRFCRDKVFVVKNTPIDPGFNEKLTVDKFKIKVVFAGWLDEGRGIETLLTLAKENENLEVHIAGEGSKELIASISNLKNVVYHGFLNHHDVLNLTSECDFVFAHYSPHRVINIFAAPNKLAEALAVGRPVIINSETKVSGPVIEYNCGIVTPYNDVKNIIELINKAVSEPERYHLMSKNSRALFEESYSWESVKENTLKVINNI